MFPEYIRIEVEPYQSLAAAGLLFIMIVAWFILERTLALNRVPQHIHHALPPPPPRLVHSHQLIYLQSVALRLLSCDLK